MYKMIYRNQTIKVRIKGASLIGLVAKLKSLGSNKEKFEQYFMEKKLRLVCQDLHWEVRKEMCNNLIYISKLVGRQKT